MKKLLTIKLLLVSVFAVLLCMSIPFFAMAQTNQTAPPATTNPTTGGATNTPTVSSSGTYVFLAPLGTTTTFDPSQDNALSLYLNIVIKILIGVAAVLAMVMIVLGGIEYMTSSLVSNKADGKHKITNAVIGLLLALGAYLLLYTINPALLTTVDVKNIQQVDATQTDIPAVVAPNGQVVTPTSGGTCTGGSAPLLSTNATTCAANGGTWTTNGTVTGNGSSTAPNTPLGICTLLTGIQTMTAAQCAQLSGTWTPQ